MSFSVLASRILASDQSPSRLQYLDHQAELEQATVPRSVRSLSRAREPKQVSVLISAVMLDYGDSPDKLTIQH